MIPYEVFGSPEVSGRIMARLLIAESCPAGLIDWCRWEWVEIPTGQMWPLSKERRR